jgi:hypothetical protein
MATNNQLGPVIMVSIWNEQRKLFGSLRWIAKLILAIQYAIHEGGLEVLIYPFEGDTMSGGCDFHYLEIFSLKFSII